MKKTFIVIVIIMVLAAGAAGYWLIRRPQTISFSDGAKLTLLSVDYGKKHTPPTVSRSAPRTRSGSFNTTNDTLVLWVRQQYDPKQNHYFQYYIYDQAGTACVQTYANGGNNRGNDVVGVRIDSFPRRQSKFSVRVQSNGSGEQEVAEKAFIIRNPASKSFSSWTEESLPATKTDDDLAVTMTKLAVGVQMPFNRGDVDADDAMNKGVAATFHVERNGKAVSNWQPISVTTSDATGNQVQGWVSQNNWKDGDDDAIYQYGLWTGEPWKIRLEFSQQSDFSDEELWSVLAVPLQPGSQQEMWRNSSRTNAGFAETDLNGFHVKLYPAKQFTDVGENNWLQGAVMVQVTPRLKDGYRMTVKATDDQTNDVQVNDYGSSGNNNSVTYRYALHDIAGLTNLNLSVALHKSRYVEFTVKPEK